MDQYLETSVGDFHEGNPYTLVWMFFLGLALGSLVLLLLSYFPGKSSLLHCTIIINYGLVVYSPLMLSRSQEPLI